MQVKTYRPNKPEYVSIITLNKDDATASFEKTDIGSNPPGIGYYRPHTGRQYQKRLLLCRQRLRTRHDSYLFPIYRKQRLEP